MGKQKKQELPDPEQQAIEEHVKQLMDPSIPDVPVVDELPTEIKLEDTSAESKAPATSTGKQKITVMHLDDEPVSDNIADESVLPEEPEAPLEETGTPSAPKLDPKAKKIVPVFHEETLEEQSTKIIEKTDTVSETAPVLAAPIETAAEEETTDLPAEEEVQPSEDETKQPEPEVVKAKDRFTPLTTIRPQAEEPEPLILNDPGTAAAVDDIVAAESDRVLQAEDEERELIQAFKRPKPKAHNRLGRAIARWWRNPWARWLTIVSLLAATAAVAAVPTSRYYALNAAGVRSSASIVVLDDSTQQPLKNVKITIAGQSSTTGSDGKATVRDVPLGPTQITIEKRAFAPLKKSHTIGWGSNPLGEFRIIPTGNQYVLTVKDYLSDKPIEGIEAASGEASALSNDKGEIRLTTDEKDIDALDIIIKGENYREEKLRVDLDDKAAVTVQMVSDRKHVFLSKRSGKFDVYKVDIDGKNEELVLAGTGTERDDMVIVHHPTDNIAAVVSSRDNKRNDDGFLLSTLTVIDLLTKQTKGIVTSERIQIVDWVEGRLVYVAISEGASASDPKRHRLMSYDVKSGNEKELAATNFFNDVMAVGNRIYYAPSAALQKSGETGLIKIDAEGGNKQTLVNREVWNLFRTGYDHIAIATPQQWFDYKVGDSTPAKLEGAPANPTNKTYINSPDGKRSLWVDNRDGKGVLLFYDPVGKTDSIIRTQSGLKGPLRWLNNTTLVFRISTDQETADFALNLEGGDAKKIRDVTSSDGVDKWYYY